MPSTAECLEIVNEFFIDIRLEASRSHESAETWKFWIEERVPRASAAAAEIRRKMVDMMENGEQRRMATEESYEKTSEITRKMLELMEKQQNDLPLERRLIYPPRPQVSFPQTFTFAEVVLEDKGVSSFWLMGVPARS